jgi:anaerobic selenocysteine-containing dehydrogenase
VVSDPLRTKSAEQADLHLANLPGTDVLLGWALATELERMGAFDDKFITANVLGFDGFMARAREWPTARAAAACGVPESQILTFAQWLAEADPLVMVPGHGLERGRNGGSGIRAAIALPALLGKFGQGSGIAISAGNAFPKTLAKLQRPELAPPGTRTLDLVDFGRHLVEDDLDPPLRALFTYNHNLIVVHPDQNRMRAPARDDINFFGTTQAMTEKQARAHIVSPAATDTGIPTLRLLWPSMATCTGLNPVSRRSASRCPIPRSSAVSPRALVSTNRASRRATRT